MAGASVGFAWRIVLTTASNLTSFLNYKSLNTLDVKKASNLTSLPTGFIVRVKLWIVRFQTLAKTLTRSTQQPEEHDRRGYWDGRELPEFVVDFQYSIEHDISLLKKLSFHRFYEAQRSKFRNASKGKAVSITSKIMDKFQCLLI